MAARRAARRRSVFAQGPERPLYDLGDLRGRGSAPPAPRRVRRPGARGAARRWRRSGGPRGGRAPRARPAGASSRRRAPCSASSTACSRRASSPSAMHGRVASTSSAIRSKRGRAGVSTAARLIGGMGRRRCVGLRAHPPADLDSAASACAPSPARKPTSASSPASQALPDAAAGGSTAPPAAPTTPSTASSPCCMALSRASSPSRRGYGSGTRRSAEAAALASKQEPRSQFNGSSKGSVTCSASPGE